MASTAEELSSQAEQLQSTIGFFKIGQQGSGMARQAVVSHQMPTVQSESKSNTSQLTHETVPTTHAGSEATDQRGIALDMGGGTDNLDDEFEKY